VEDLVNLEILNLATSQVTGFSALEELKNLRLFSCLNPRMNTDAVPEHIYVISE
jgi:hypothetical protein